MEAKLLNRTKFTSLVAMAIPKIIHQTVKDKYELHPILRANVEKLKMQNKDWEYRLYDDKECRMFISEYYGADFTDSYDRISPRYGAARADFFRYLVMYRFGGVYLDIKSSAHRPLDDVLKEDDVYLLSHWPAGQLAGIHENFGVLREFQQWHIIAVPGHPFLAATISIARSNINSYDPARDGIGRIGTLRLTGPIAYTLAIEPIRQLHAHRLVDIAKLGFEYSIVGPKAHKSLFGHVHYSNVKSPIVKCSFAKNVFFLTRYSSLFFIKEISKKVKKRIKRYFPGPRKSAERARIRVP